VDHKQDSVRGCPDCAEAFFVWKRIETGNEKRIIEHAQRGSLDRLPIVADLDFVFFKLHEVDDIRAAALGWLLLLE
jgi:hypothetical protein